MGSIIFTGVRDGVEGTAMPDRPSQSGRCLWPEKRMIPIAPWWLIPDDCLGEHDHERNFWLN